MARKRILFAVDEEFVPFDIAKLLKGKGFECVTQYKYRHDGSFCDSRDERFQPLCDYRRPTQQMAMAWLRKYYGYHVLVSFDKLEWNFKIIDIERTNLEYDPVVMSDTCAGYGTYEEAANEGIRYCLENLCDYCNEIGNDIRPRGKEQPI